ncbi:retinol dehydrogenase 12-like isoform X1 [Garra rufa]|uniref:retinol dehydrogenase 12-like isoform X1 n=1 Tax=Garra rufa TaxID=137080 RepID=UPI003CCE7B32
MYTVLLICGGLVGLYLLLYVMVLRMPKCKSTAKLHGKTVIVTGANTGIGKATALDLAKRGARVILACRDESRAQAAVTDIQRESGNKEVLYMHLDLASLKSVRSFAENFLKKESRLDILINNAGLVVGGRTEDGFGRIFGVNHLGHFLLTILLLERLKQCSPSRVVTVSSNAHWWGKIDFDCINTHKDLGLGNSAVALMRLYGHSKLCNVLFTHELAKRLKGTNVTCYSLHPGVVMGGKTEDGFGSIFGVNHLGHFLLTILLLERLKECGPSRVVTVSSNSHWCGKLDFNCINTHKDLGLGNSTLAIIKLYNNSKPCNVLFTHELAKRLKDTNVTCYSLHPGGIKTEVGRHVNLWLRLFMVQLLLLFFSDMESGAQTSLYCALQEGIEPLSGRYFSSCAVQNISAKARDDAVAKKLWEVSERLVDLA